MITIHLHWMSLWAGSRTLVSIIEIMEKYTNQSIPSETTFYVPIPWTWHFGQILLCIFTGGIWLMVYPFKYMAKKRPVMRSYTR